MKNFVGLFNRHGIYHFINNENLIHLFIQVAYREKVVGVLYDCRQAFATVPRLMILKRDDYTAYEQGLDSDLLFIKFDSVKKAEDWFFALPMSNEIQWEIYENGRLVRNQKGVVACLKAATLSESNQD